MTIKYYDNFYFILKIIKQYRKWLQYKIRGLTLQHLLDVDKLVLRQNLLTIVLRSECLNISLPS